MATVSVHALSAGSLTLPERFFVSPADQEASRTVPSLSFLIQHHSSRTNKTTRIVFDLGMRRDISQYPPILQEHCASREPVTTQPDVVASLAGGGLSVDDIDYVIFSHVHYDHVGLPRDFSNPRTKFIVGPGALDLLSGKVKLHSGKHCTFEPDLLPPERTIELPPLSASTTDQPSPPRPDTIPDEPVANLTHWSRTPLHPFQHSIDLLSDSSVHLISAPGHLPGHLNLLVRRSVSGPSPDRSADLVLLAGDAFHDIRLLDGTHSIATWTDGGRPCCIHADAAVADDTIRRLREVRERGMVVPLPVGAAGGEENHGGRVHEDVEIVFAHDWQWEADARRRDRYFPGRL